MLGDVNNMTSFTKSFPTLYKNSSKGKEQEWTIAVSAQADDTAKIVTFYGQVDGEKQTATVHVTKGKNLGKANATTPWTQALSDAESKWKKQLDKGYSEERGGASLDLKPMLAHTFEDHEKKVVYPCRVQPKLDGVRCLAYRDGDKIRLISRNGKEHVGLNHIREELIKLLHDGEIWDGELYNHDLTFQNIISFVKKDQPGSCSVKYYVYDKVSDEDFETRYTNVFERIINHDDTSTGPVRHLVTYGCEDREHLDRIHAVVVSEGYEGIMVRWGGCEYKRGRRSNQLLKVKKWKTDEFKIVDVVPGLGKMEDQGIFVCEVNNTTFSAKPEGTDEQRREYLANKSNYIGKMATIRYFEWTTSEPSVPRFPIAEIVRDYE